MTVFEPTDAKFENPAGICGLNSVPPPAGGIQQNAKNAVVLALLMLSVMEGKVNGVAGTATVPEPCVVPSTYPPPIGLVLRLTEAYVPGVLVLIFCGVPQAASVGA